PTKVSIMQIWKPKDIFLSINENIIIKITAYINKIVHENHVFVLNNCCDAMRMLFVIPPIEK
ncbi:hypothetical protein, partial [Kingella kingae]|uniref:hypothetical protein n=1 Tax=Kingella kingae TaxID=504 RepID=UPI001E57DAA7